MDPVIENTEPEKIKVGEKEYTQDELQSLVGLGEMGREAEEKYNVKLDKVWPNLQQTINDKLELQKQLEDERAAKAAAAAPQAPVADQEIAQKAKEELARLGYVNKDEIQKIVNDTVSAHNLIKDANSMISEQVANGNPNTTIQDLFAYMDGHNPTQTRYSSPEKAYKDMFEEEVRANNDRKIESLKQPGMVTINSSTAGSKAPAPQKITKDNLQDALHAALASQ